MNWRLYALSSCCCTGSDGREKTLYDTEQEAERVARLILERRGVELRVYECPDAWGWHLTSNLWGGW